ncbi:DNA polymerase II [Marinomonas sp.]
MIEGKGYIISRHTKEVEGRIEQSFFVKTPQGTVQLFPEKQFSIFFTNAPLDIFGRIIDGLEITASPYRSFSKESVAAIKCHSLTLQKQAIKLIKSHGYEVYEEDIKAHNRYLMERDIRGAVRFIGEPDLAQQRYHQARLIPGDWQPQWRVWSLDIETSVTNNTLLSIGITCDEERCVFVVTDSAYDAPGVYVFRDEKSLLLAFIQFVKKHSPDIFIGWNLISFDLHFIDQRCQILGVRPAFGVNGETWQLRASDNQGRYFISIPGRVALDGITLLKVGGYHFESYSLNHVSQQILQDSKLLKGSSRWQEIERMHAEDLPMFIAYNLQDCDLVYRIFNKLKLIELQQTRVDLTGIPFEQPGGSVAAFENLYLPRLHNKGWVAPAWRDEAFVASPGGFVMSSIPGLYKNVLVFDFKSLYPSIIRTFFIDPLARICAQGHPEGAEGQNVPGYLGASFSKSEAILPELVSELAHAREAAKKSSNDVLSYAIKIIMNSFYGVLGSNVCRFYHAELASSITMRGHELLGLTKKWMEESGAKVIYGDTDSLFVTLVDDVEDPQKEGSRLCHAMNVRLKDWCADYAQLDSKLELEFERLYSRFFMPTIRGQEEGSKKRYAGLANDELVFKGLEAARTDWTPLARNVQRKLFELIFNDENPIGYIQSVIADLLAGKFDQDLIYSKQLSRPLSAYTKNKPPHVRAATMIDEERKALGQPLEFDKGRKRVAYYYQLSGVKPYNDAEKPTNIDYDHYIEKQITPIADSLLPFFNTNMETLLSKQMTLL